MNNKKLIPVWDIFVRIFHWSLVLTFTIAFLTEDDFETLHAYAGYAVLGLISFRVIWGFIGSRYARFSNFIYPISEVKKYLTSLRSPEPINYLGHNPAGGLMIMVLLFSLFGTTLSGLKVYGLEGHGPLADNGFDISIISEAYADNDDEHEGSEEEELWEEIHELFANFTLLLVFIHVAGVLSSSIVHGENLVRAMVTGKKEEE